MVARQPSGWQRCRLAPVRRAAQVGGTKPGPDLPGGLPREVLEDVAQSLLLQLPVEVYASPYNPAFW